MDLLIPVDEFADPFLDPDARLETQHASGVRQVGIREPYVTWLIGVALDARFPTQRLCDQRDHPVGTHARAVGQVPRLACLLPRSGGLLPPVKDPGLSGL